MTRFADDTRFWEIRPSSQITTDKGTGGETCAARKVDHFGRVDGPVGAWGLEKCVAALLGEEEF